MAASGEKGRLLPQSSWPPSVLFPLLPPNPRRLDDRPDRHQLLVIDWEYRLDGGLGVLPLLDTACVPEICPVWCAWLTMGSCTKADDPHEASFVPWHPTSTSVVPCPKEQHHRRMKPCGLVQEGPHPSSLSPPPSPPAIRATQVLQSGPIPVVWRRFPKSHHSCCKQLWYLRL